MRHQVTDPVAAVEEPTALPVDEAEARLTGDDPFEAGGEGALGGRCVCHAPMVVGSLSVR